jgi:hypothetical protein
MEVIRMPFERISRACMQWLWRTIDLIVPACLGGLLASGLGILLCYIIVGVRRSGDTELPTSVQFISRWSVRLAWLSFACFWIVLLGGFAVMIAYTVFVPGEE